MSHAYLKDFPFRALRCFVEKENLLSILDTAFHALIFFKKNKAGTSKVGAISKAQKAQKTFL